MRCIGWLALAGCASVGPGVDDGSQFMDFDGDGVRDSEDPDADGDGIPDVDDDFVDLDRDGFDRLEDCDDTNPAVNPGAVEVCGNGLDDDCDGSAKTCRLEGELSLDDAASTARGEQPGDRFGSQVVLLGDADGDGFSDLVVGAESVGAAWRFAGSETGPLRARTAAQRWSGESPDFARTIAGGRDITGDGLAELVFSEPFWSSTERTSVGRVSIRPGVGEAEAEVAVIGAAAFETLGQSVQLADDLYGDGLADLWVTVAGEPVLVVKPGQGGVRREGLRLRNSADEGPLSLPVVGDINGDGDGDLLVQRSGNRRQALLFVEPPMGVLFDTDADIQRVADLGVPKPTPIVTGAVALADVNGDGYDDAIVSRGGFYYTPSYDGAVGIAFGNGKADLGAADVIIEGANDRGPYGGLLRAADLDSDGKADLAFSVDGSDLVVFYDLPESGTLTVDDWDVLLPGRPEFPLASLDIAPGPNDDFTRSLAVGYPDDAGLVVVYRFSGL